MTKRGNQVIFLREFPSKKKVQEWNSWANWCKRESRPMPLFIRS